MATGFDLDTPLIHFVDGNSVSTWTIREAVENLLIVGGIGTGKTSSSGATVALKFLNNGFGGLVLTTKVDERQLWVDYCRIAGRSEDLIIVEPGSGNTFDIIEYESADKDAALGVTENLVQVLKTVMQASEERSGGSSDDRFWEDALDMLLYNVTDLCLLAHGKVSVKDMYNIVMAAPKEAGNSGLRPTTDTKAEPTAFDAAFSLARKNVFAQIRLWEAEQAKETLLELKQHGMYDEALLDAIADARLLKAVDQFFSETYRHLSEKTRAIVFLMFTGFLFRLMREPVYSLFFKGASTFTPDDCFDGKIILLNLPVKTYHKVGQDIQIMFKYIWQRAMEKRDVESNGRPVFCWADEAQTFLHPLDPSYLATGRSSRIANVYISQNLPNFYSNLGGAKSEYKVKALLGTMGTKIFHNNADMETNEYASRLIGEAYVEDTSASKTVGGQYSHSESVTFKLERMVRPEKFTGLKSGGPLNDFLVEGYVHRQSKSFPDGWNYRKITFEQTRNQSSKQSPTN